MYQGNQLFTVGHISIITYLYVCIKFYHTVFFSQVYNLINITNFMILHLLRNWTEILAQILKFEDIWIKCILMWTFYMNSDPLQQFYSSSIHSSQDKKLNKFLSYFYTHYYIRTIKWCKVHVKLDHPSLT